MFQDGPFGRETEAAVPTLFDNSVFFKLNSLLSRGFLHARRQQQRQRR